MDPTATWHAIAEALRDGDREEAIYLLRELARWIERGGFLPQIPSTDGE